MNRQKRQVEIEERKSALRTFNSEDHIAEAEHLVELAERQGMAPAACYAGATAHTTLAIAKATLGRN